VAGPRSRRDRQTGNRGRRQLGEHRVAIRECVVHLQSLGTDPHDAPALKRLEQARFRDLNHVRHLVRLQASKWTKDRLAVGACDIHTVERDDVQVRIQSHVARAALNDVQQSCASRVIAWRQTVLVPTKKRVLKDPCHDTHQAGLVRKRCPQGKGQAPTPEVDARAGREDAWSIAKGFTTYFAGCSCATERKYADRFNQ
jgi:hypothetical protein